jgi:NAD(P)-dependent dehydrogenase (short-subunit alcohol dehydrogenase family)
LATSDPGSSSKIALVTGGSRGLGRNTVIALAGRGTDSIFTYHSNRAEADNVVAGVATTGQRAVALQLDTGDVRAFDPFVERVRQALSDLGRKRFDFLVNNAGTSLHKAFDQTTEEELDQVYRVHFKGVFFLTQKLLPLINDGGRIVNISSGLARFSMPGSSAYGAMKGAVEVLTRYLAKELGSRGYASSGWGACRLQPFSRIRSHLRRQCRRVLDRAPTPATMSGPLACRGRRPSGLSAGSSSSSPTTGRSPCLSAGPSAAWVAGPSARRDAHGSPLGETLVSELLDEIESRDLRLAAAVVLRPQNLNVLEVIHYNPEWPFTVGARGENRLELSGHRSPVHSRPGQLFRLYRSMWLCRAAG